MDAALPERLRDWQDYEPAKMFCPLMIKDAVTAADELEKLRAALNGVIEAWVNPADGGPYEHGEVPALDAARAALTDPAIDGVAAAIPAQAREE